MRGEAIDCQTMCISKTISSKTKVTEMSKFPQSSMTANIVHRRLVDEKELISTRFLVGMNFVYTRSF